MTFKLSRRSLDRLEGIDERLQAVVKQAITLTKTDFGVIQGMRTLEQQKELVAKGASQTMKSKHLEGKAFDIMAFINGRASWELNLYDDLADAVKEAAIIVGGVSRSRAPRFSFPCSAWECLPSRLPRRAWEPVLLRVGVRRRV